VHPRNERPAATQRPAAESSAPIEPRAERVLREMARYMDSLKSFRLETTAIDEKFTDNGRKIQELAEAQITIQRPNRVRIDRRGPMGRRASLRRPDGDAGELRQAGLRDPRLSESLGGMFDLVREKLHIDAPGADLLADPYDALTQERPRAGTSVSSPSGT